MQTPRSAAEQNQRRRIAIISGVICAAFLAALDTTILATVMPTIVSELGGLSLYSWVFSTYMIMTAVSTPIWGKLSDTFGRRPTLFASIVLFLGGSALCGLSQGMTHLIISRGIQGIGAGGLASIPFALVSSIFPPNERGKALGLLSSTWGISSVIGPLIGSFIVLHFSWRWVFYVNIPGGLAAILIVASHYREEASLHKESIDYVGGMLLCSSIVSLLLTSLWAGKGSGLFSPGVIGSFCVFIACTFVFVLRERQVAHPILELQFFHRRAFWVGNLLGFLASFAVYGVIVYMPLFAHTVLQSSALNAGVVIASMSLSWSVTSVIAGRVVYKVGEKVLITGGMILMLAGFMLAIFTSPESSFSYLMLCVIIIGGGMGSQTPSLMLSVQYSLEPKNIGVATSTQMLARTIGGAIGVSIMGSTVAGSMLKQFGELTHQGLLLGLPDEAKAHLTQPQELLGAHVRAFMSQQDAALVVATFTNALHDGFMVGLVVTLVAVAVSLLLPRSVLHKLN